MIKILDPTFPEFVIQNETVRNNSLSFINLAYGRYSPNPREYHDVCHSRDDVMPLAREMGAVAVERGRISEFTAELVVTGAATHDIEVLLEMGKNEIASAEITKERMNQPDVPLLNGKPAFLVARLNESTAVKLTSNDILQNVVDDLNNEENFASAILCDADLGSLGLPFYTYLDRMLRLHREFRIGVTDPDERRAGLKSLTEHNIGILSTHEWHTGDLANQFRPFMRSNGQYLESIYYNKRERELFLARFA